MIARKIEKFNKKLKDNGVCAILTAINIKLTV